MDFSHVKNVKKHIKGETNYSPVSRNILKRTARSGLQICCYYEHVPSSPKRKRNYRSCSFYCISHLIGGDGYYVVPERKEPVMMSPGQAVIVCPGKVHNYGGWKKDFVEDSICFIGPAADTLRDAGIICDGVIHFGRERRLFTIIQKIREGTLLSILDANFMLLQLLINLHKKNPVGTETQPEISLGYLLNEINTAPERWWTVDEMADCCGISTNYLRELFRKKTGMSPKQYIDQIKTGRASEMLCSSKLKISEIAEMLGFKDPFHFTRRFTKLTGLSPKRFRERYGRN